MDNPLAAQADKLNRTIRNRQKRRNADRNERLRSGDNDGFPSTQPVASKPSTNATGGVRLGTESHLAAIAATGRIAPPRLFRCDICNATCTSDSQMQQHLEGPVHRKTVQRVEAERAKRRRLQQHSGLASAALEAAAWNAAQGQQVVQHQQQHQQHQHQQHQQQPLHTHLPQQPSTDARFLSTMHASVGMPAAISKLDTGTQQPRAQPPPHKLHASSSRSAGQPGGYQRAHMPPTSVTHPKAPAAAGHPQQTTSNHQQCPHPLSQQSKVDERNSVCISHEALIGRIRVVEEPISIDGWVPPGLSSEQGSGDVGALGLSNVRKASTGPQRISCDHVEGRGNPGTQRRISVACVEEGGNPGSEDESGAVGLGLANYSDDDKSEESESGSDGSSSDVSAGGSPKIVSFF